MNDIERICNDIQRKLDDMSRPGMWERYTKNMECGELLEFKQYYKDLEIILRALTVQECGHWIEKPSGAYGRWQSWCSSCGKHSGIGGIESNRHKPYCPNCGVKMMPQPPKEE